jgi:hypothetical protein
MHKKTAPVLILPFLFTGLLIGIIFSNLGYAQENLRENPSLPPIKMQGQTEFVSGGVGKDESEAMLQASKEWPLTLELAQGARPRAEYISDVQIKIMDTKGNVVLDADSAGPYLLVKLSPGKYVLDATYNSVTLHRKLNLEAGSGKKISLIWPEARQD